MLKLKNIGVAVSCLLPSPMACLALRALGYSVGIKVKIGFSFVFVDSLSLGDNTSIGSGCILICNSITLKQSAYIGRLNILHGPFSVILCKYAAIGNGNKITRGPLIDVTSGRAFIRLGVLSKVTADHRIDLTRSVVFGKYTTLAGVESQIWTHGYVHALTGPGRYRIDGSVVLGDNVYIGSGSIICSGVRIDSSIQVGAGTVVSKSLSEKGVYVSQGLRVLPLPADPNLRQDLSVDEAVSGEIVFTKGL
jgi:acetyltransferase-like isoleucine patch superfamily enzyme